MSDNLSSPKVSQALKKLARAARSANRRKSGQAETDYQSLEPRQLLATIAWSSGDITGDSDVSTNGSLVFALSGSESTGNSTTVNGVGFVQSTLTNAASQAQSQSPGNESITTSIFNDNQGSFTNGGLSNSSIGDIIEGGWWGTAPMAGNTASVTLTGLAVGEDYELQVFANDGRNSRHDGYISRLDDGSGGTGVDLALNNQPNGGRAGDFGLGTFTADSSTQTFTISGFLNGPNNGRVHLNAIQLRRVDTPDLLPGSHPLINEFSASNSSIIDDDNGESSDWIEIYNAGTDAIDLAGYSLTDDPTNTDKFVFSSTILGGGQYLVVFAGDDLNPTAGTDLYTEFALKAGGEYVGLYDASGALVSEFGTGGADYPQQYTDVSYGYLGDNNFNQVSYFATPTPRFCQHRSRRWSHRVTADGQC